MRDLIIARIEEIKQKENNFSKKLFRWKNAYIGDIHISSINFNTLSDIDVVSAYESIVRQVSKCM